MTRPLLAPDSVAAPKPAGDPAAPPPAPERPRPAPGLPAIFGGTPLFTATLPMVRPALPAAAPVLEDFRRSLESGRLTNGEHVRRLEREAADLLEVPECVAVSSCTSGLMLVERCLGLAGQVIVPSFTFFATAHSLLWNGLEPVLADCDPHTWNLDSAAAARALRPGVSAILAVHMYGNPAPAAELASLARRAAVRLIFDAAHAFGARSGGRSIGGAGDAEVFSLSPTKLLVAGEGGLVATRHRDLARALRAARNYGHDGDYDCRMPGLNARMTELQAALARAGLGRVAAEVRSRNRIALAYEECLRGQPGLRFQSVPAACRSTRKDFSLIVDGRQFGVSRDFLRRALERENVEVRCYFDPPLHRQRLYARFYRPAQDPLAVSEALSRGVLSLPIYSALSESDAARIARRILAIRDCAAGGMQEAGCRS